MNAPFTSNRNMTRRTFTSIAALGALSAATGGLAPNARAARGPAGTTTRPRRVGAVAYAFQYSIGLFTYKDRPGDRMDALKFVEATREAGGDVAQLYFSMITSLSETELKRLHDRAAELDVALEVHGGYALTPRFDAVLQPAAALGIKVVGCSFGMLLRPDRIATLDAWDAHTEKCLARLKELARAARPLGITIGVENHLDFTVEELHDLVKKADSPHVGVIFDVGNTVGTLDDPTEAADILGPHVVATHYKDFAIEEVPRGFRFTMIPLGAGSLRLGDITERLDKHVGPDVNFSIEMMNGQHFEVKWLEDRFWTAYRHKPGREVAATLRHIRSKAIDMHECIPVEEIDTLPYEAHCALEFERMRRCISYLRDILA